MNPPEPGVASQPPPAPRKSRARAVGLILALVIVLAGAATAYYYLFYLPATPKAVLAQYLALGEKGDADGTYRFLSERSRKFLPAGEWKAKMAESATVRAQLTVAYTVGEPRYTGSQCRVRVNQKTSFKNPPKWMPPAAKSSSTETTVVLVKEKGGWKVGLVEQTVQENIERMSKSGLYSKKQIEDATKRLNAFFDRPYQGNPTR